MSCCCLEPMWFVGDPTSLAHDNTKGVTSISKVVYIYLEVRILTTWAIWGQQMSNTRVGRQNNSD